MCVAEHDGDGASLGKRFGMFLGSGLVLLLSLTVLFTPEAEAQELEKVYFEFDFSGHTHKEMKVGPGDSKIVHFKGQIHYITPIPQARQVLLNLRAEAVHDPSSPPSKSQWFASIYPPTPIFDPTTKVRDIRVTVTGVPFDRKDVSYKIVLSGAWQVNPGPEGVIEPFSLTVTTGQYFMMRSTSPQPFKTGFPGERRSYQIQIKNEGNGIDSFKIDFENEDALSRVGFVIVADQRETRKVGGGGTVNYTFGVIGPQMPYTLWRTRLSEIAVSVTSKASLKSGREAETMYSSVFYQEKGTYFDFQPCLGVMVFILVLLPLSFLYYKRRRRGKKKKGEWK